jgi:hypothetical protein
MYVKLPWRPEADENWAIMVVQPAILTYPTMVFYFWLAPRVLWNDLRGIVISVCQKNTKNQYAVLPGIFVRVLASHFSSVIGNFWSSGWLELHVYIFIKAFGYSGCHGDTNNYNLRNSHNISQTANRLSISQQSFFPSTTKLMNLLDLRIRQLLTFESFKYKLKQHYYKNAKPPSYCIKPIAVQ